MKRDVKDLPLSSLENEVKRMVEGGYRAKQIFDWVYKKGAVDFDSMTNLPVGFREKFKKRFEYGEPLLVGKKTSRDGTEKYLLRLQDGNLIETVFIPTARRNTVCLSTQVGCRYGCSFCSSGTFGFQRDMSCAEIVSQLLFLKLHEKKSIDNLVFMGIGEPLDNCDNLIKALDIINSKEGMEIGARKITISTCGIVPGIRKLAETGKQFELSISLHAADDIVRRRLMPVNSKYPIKEVLSAARYFAGKTKRRITFEYVLIDKVNDDPRMARRLGELLKGSLSKVNLIRLNPTPELPFEPPNMERVRDFQSALQSAGVSCTLRKPRGQDIAAACGQLRAKEMP